jgi:hypothetical protein
MRYVTQSDVTRHHLQAIFDTCGNISATGSVLGMQRQFGWPKGGQVRMGGYIYNVGPVAVAQMRSMRILKGE